MKWIDKICKVLEKPKYKNTSQSYVVKKGNTVVETCALGELVLRGRCKKEHTYERMATWIKRCLLHKYNVPEDQVDEVFNKINNFNICGQTKRQIAKLLVQEYKT